MRSGLRRPPRCPLLQSKKNRILLRQKPVELPAKLIKTLLNGVIEQDADLAELKRRPISGS